MPCVFPLNPCHVCLADDRAEVGQGGFAVETRNRVFECILGRSTEYFQYILRRTLDRRNPVFYRKSCNKESADLTNVNFKGGNYGG